MNKNKKQLRESGYGSVANSNKLYKNPAKALGIVITPSHITNLMANLINLKPSDYLLDECAGTGAFLEAGRRLGVKHLYGIEKDKHIYSILKSNLGNIAHLYHGNCFDYNFKQTPINKILLNPPYQLPCIEFIQHALNILTDGGEMAVIVPYSVFISGGRSKRKTMKKCKQYILNNCHIKAIVTTNPKTFYPVGTETCILVLKKAVGKGTGKQRVRLYNFAKDGYKLVNKHGLVKTSQAHPKYIHLIHSINTYQSTKLDPNALTATLTNNNGWFYNAHYTNPNPPTAKDFQKTTADYLTFKTNMILHGRGYLFKEGSKND